MRALHMIVVLLIVSFGSASLGTCQTTDSANDLTSKHDSYSLSESNQITIDVPVLAVVIGYAKAATDRSLLGGEVGIGFDALGYTAVAGPHYKEGWLWEFLHAAGFWRYQPREFLQIDAGIRASYFIHVSCPTSGGGDDSWSSDEPAGFLGGYAGIYVGSRHIKFGSRVLVGDFFGCSKDPEFCVHLMPLTVRFMIPW
jgi:hypothetical protein